MDTPPPPPPTYRSKVKVILRSRIYTKCCRKVIHPYAKIWYAYVKEQRHLARLECNLTHPPLVIDPYAKYGMPMSKLTEVTAMTKAYKFDLEVKGQHRIGNMNIRVTSFHGDRPMCPIW